jgi:hypothetical protein
VFPQGVVQFFGADQSRCTFLFQHFFRDGCLKRKLWQGGGERSRSHGSRSQCHFTWWGIVDLITALQLGAAKYGFKIFIALFDTAFIHWAKRLHRLRAAEAVA